MTELPPQTEMVEEAKALACYVFCFIFMPYWHNLDTQEVQQWVT